MAKKMVITSGYRTSELKDGAVERTIYRPGTELSKLPKDAQKQFEEDGLVVDHRLFDQNAGVVIPMSELSELPEDEADDDEEEESTAKKTASSSSSKSS